MIKLILIVFLFAYVLPSALLWLWQRVIQHGTEETP
jgi:hypothetical protein